MEEVLKIVDLYKEGIINGVSFTVSKGEMIAIMGPSGSGKSSLLYQVSGMDKHDSGDVWLCKQKLEPLSEDERAKIRLEKVGFVFQHMYMLKNQNIIDNIMFPAIQLYGKRARDRIRDQAKMLMRSLNIEDLANRDIISVSGGELQRACICRSLINQPEIILADEPTGALNQSSARDVLNVFRNLNNNGVTILMVTHDSKVAAICNRILYITDGNIRGELSLSDITESIQREECLSDWLSEKGW